MTDQQRLNAALAGRYRVEREIGAGGMATVYLATDLRHERKVALKVLRPDLASSLGAERFLREVRVTANLQHPHILPLYDSGEADGFLFYVMPFIEGESLRSRLAREGELPVAEAARLLRDVVDALTAAHRVGVVHRDIKPENVLLSGRHAMVADFGVAKAVSEATGRTQLTTAGVALGTPSYMAPEQAAADEKIDHRADIYAMGVMAYELLTGRTPFHGRNAQEILTAQIMESPRPITEFRASVPPSLATVIMRCLEKKAADRWQTAEEILLQLEAVITPTEGMTPAVAPVAGKPSRRWMAMVAGLVVALACGVIGYTLFRSQQTGAGGTLIGDNVLREDDRIMVVEFSNHTDDQGLAEAVTDAVRVDLQQSGVVKVLSQADMYEGIRGMGLEPGIVLNDSLTKDLTERMNAKAYVAGDVRSLGTGYQITARVVGVADGEEALTERVTAEDDASLIPALDELGRRLRQGMGESLQDLRTRQPLAQVTTSSLPALRAFTSAVREFNQSGQTRAVALLEQAVRLDTAFAAAWEFLGSLKYNQGRAKESREALERAYQHRDRLNASYRLAVEFRRYLEAGDRTQAAAAFQRLQEIDPGAFMMYWADWALKQRNWEEAESMSLRSIELNDPPWFVDYANAMEAMVSLKRFAAADSLLGDMARRLPGHPYLVTLRLQLLYGQRDFDRVEVFLDSLDAEGAWPQRVWAERCWLALARGQDSHMRECLEGRVQREVGLWELRYLGDTARASWMADSLLTWALPNDAPTIALLAELGAPERARDALAGWEERVGSEDPVFRMEIGQAAGAIALAEGKPDSAVAAFLSWNTSGFPGGTHIYNRGLFEAADAYDRGGHSDSAIALYERALDHSVAHGRTYEIAWYPRALTRLAELHDSLGHPTEAVSYYRKLIDLWDHADDSLQPRVEAARKAVARLRGGT